MSEQDRTIEALRTAIQMENDGRQCYLEAVAKSSNTNGKELLESLAGEEDEHRRRFEEIYDSIRQRKGWPKKAFEPNKDTKIRSLLAKACVPIGKGVKTPKTEVDTIKTAMDKEDSSYDFYQKQSEGANYDAEREFYKALATEERGHKLVLLDYYEYLTDPAGYFLGKEHSSLDGG